MPAHFHVNTQIRTAGIAGGSDLDRHTRESLRIHDNFRQEECHIGTVSQLVGYNKTI